MPKKVSSKASPSVAQSYPRIESDGKELGCLDDKQLVKHSKKIDNKILQKLIVDSIKYANQKSSREAFSTPDTIDEAELKAHYKKSAKELFIYFHKYCDDPASTSQNLQGKHYTDVCMETFRNRVLQKQRMNSGWRYQNLAKDCALESGRFNSVSDVGTAEADFNAVIAYEKDKYDPLTLYVSVKNRINTLGGQDWPKAISALEQVAKLDKNRNGAYLCVFGIAMDRGTRTIKRQASNKRAHSENTEVWLSDYFWPFFSNLTYDEIMSSVLDVLLEKYPTSGKSLHIDLPEDLVKAFGELCFNNNLIDEKGHFNDPRKTVNFFCSKIPVVKKVRITKSSIAKMPNANDSQ